jgi:hypothetical protein
MRSRLSTYPHYFLTIVFAAYRVNIASTESFFIVMSFAGLLIALDDNE